MKLKYNDAQHAYWLDGKRTKGVTTIAGIPDDTYTLNQWGKRMVAIGMAREPHLVERAAAHHDDYSAMTSIVEDALKAARTSEKADHGTAIHRILERVDLGLDMVETELSRKLRAQWPTAVETAGFTILPEYVESIVVYPEIPLCGRWDRLVKNKKNGKLMILDVKSGLNAIKYPHKTSIQLATYANAPLIAVGLEHNGKTEETEQFEKLPANVDKKWAIVAYVSPDGDAIEFSKINIAEGWKAAQKICFPVLEWRARDDLVEPLSSFNLGDPDEPASEERLTWIRGRLNGISLCGEDAKQEVVALWPHGVPGRGDWTDEQINQLDAVFSAVEKRHSAGFPVGDPVLAQHADVF